MGTTKRAYLGAYARGGFEAVPGVAYDFCVSCAARHPVAFVDAWAGTLVCDDYVGYNALLKPKGRIEAGCMAHAQR